MEPHATPMGRAYVIYYQVDSLDHIQIMHISLPGAHPAFPLTFERGLFYGFYGTITLWLRPPALLNTSPVLRVTSQACWVDGHSGCVSTSSCSASCCVCVESRKSPGTKGARTSIHVDAALDPFAGEGPSPSSLQSSSSPPPLWCGSWQDNTRRCKNIHLVHANGFLIWSPSPPVVSSRVLTCTDDLLLLFHNLPYSTG